MKVIRRWPCGRQCPLHLNFRRTGSVTPAPPTTSSHGISLIVTQISNHPPSLSIFKRQNGVHRADKTLSMTTPSLGDEESKAYIMDHTPSALSVGQRIMHRDTVLFGSKERNDASFYLVQVLPLLLLGATAPFTTRTPRSTAMTMKGSLKHAAFVSKWG